MADEKIYTIPLRREWLKVPIYKRSRKAITATKTFLQKHLKKEVRIGPALNQFIWEKGNRHPPGKIKVRIDELKETTFAELVNAPRIEDKVEDKKKKKETKDEKEDTITIKKPKILEKISAKGREEEKKAEEKKEIDKKAIEKVPVDAVKEEEEKTIKKEEEKKQSPKKEKIIATEKVGQMRKD